MSLVSFCSSGETRLCGARWIDRREVARGNRSLLLIRVGKFVRFLLVSESSIVSETEIERQLVVIYLQYEVRIVVSHQENKLAGAAARLQCKPGMAPQGEVCY